MIIKGTFRRPARQDLDLAKLPGGMPALSSLKLLPYKEEAWTQRARPTLDKIKDIDPGNPLSSREARRLSKIAIEGVSRSFGSVAAVRDISLAIEDGEFFTLLGPSGCGKTTLLRMIAGFTELDAGQIRIGERRIDTLPPHRRNIGMVFQNYAIFPNLTVAGNVAYGLKARKVAGAEIAERVARRARPGAAAGLRRALAAPALRRPAAARRHCARPGHPPGSPAARRAAVQSRCPAAGRHARRDPRPAAAPEHHHRLCHARPGGGAGRVRPHRRDAGGADRAARRSRKPSIASRQTCSSPSSWARPTSCRASSGLAQGELVRVRVGACRAARCGSRRPRR